MKKIALLILSLSIMTGCTQTHPSDSIECAKEGEVPGICVGCIPKCCDGLKKMVKLKYNGECTIYAAPSASGPCSNCGNGICDELNNEDECNCPEDCK